MELRHIDNWATGRRIRSGTEEWAMADDEQRHDGGAGTPTEPVGDTNGPSDSAPETQQVDSANGPSDSAPETQQVDSAGAVGGPGVGADDDGAISANATTNVAGFPPPAMAPPPQQPHQQANQGYPPPDPQSAVGPSHQQDLPDPPPGYQQSYQQPRSQQPGQYQQPGSHQQPARYEQPGQYQQPARYEQPGQYQQPARYEQPGQYQQPARYEQPGQYQQPARYEQPGQYQQPAHYEQPGQYQQPAHYEQPGQYQQPAGYQQPAPHEQPGQYQQPGQYEQPAGYQQPGQYQQPAHYDQHGQYQQPAGYQQPGQYQQPATQAIGADGWQQQPPQAPGQPGPQPFAGDWGSPATKSGLGSKLGRVGVVAAVLLIGGVAGFAIWRALSGPSGAETPAAAAEQLFDALDNEDLLGLAEISLPSERRSILEPSVDVLLELERLDILSDDVVDGDGNISNLAGITFDIPAAGEPDALVFETRPISGREDLHWVTVTDGVIEITYDPQVFRDGLGGRFSEWLEDNPDSGGDTIETERIDFAEERASGTPFEFAAVEEGGSYYVSYWYSAAGNATDGADTVLLPGPAPVGADSPEQAAIDALDNLVDLEAQAVLTLLDPEEFRAAYDYWGNYSPDLVAEWEQAKADAAAEGVSWDLVSAEARSEDRNGRRVAVYEELVFSIVSTNPENQADLTITVDGDGLTANGTIQNAPVELSITGTTIFGTATIEGEVAAIDFDISTYEGWYRVGTEVVNISRQDDCLLVSTNTEQELVCDEDFGFTGVSSLLDLRQDWEDALEGAGSPGLTVVERDGRWYVSGFPSYAYIAVDLLKALEPEELDGLIDNYEELIESGLDDLDS